MKAIHTDPGDKHIKRPNNPYLNQSTHINMTKEHAEHAANTTCLAGNNCSSRYNSNTPQGYSGSSAFLVSMLSTENESFILDTFVEK